MKKNIKEIFCYVLVGLLVILAGFAPLSESNFTIKWGDLGERMVEVGVIDKSKFPNYYSGKNLVVNSENSKVILNTLWALGLGNKNEILQSGPMMDQRYGGAGNFASTGGWTLSQGVAMDHYSMHELIKLTPKEQALVEKTAKNIYRPCCGNSTYFPDCNHGMAMLALLELMASQGANEKQMYKVALEVNTLWFPDTYATIETYFTAQGKDFDSVEPEIILGADYSSSSGYQKILSQIQPQERRGGAGCGV